MTNAQKFKEIFGLEPDIYSCPLRCPDGTCEFEEQDLCHTLSNWWSLEYKEEA